MKSKKPFNQHEHGQLGHKAKNKEPKPYLEHGVFEKRDTPKKDRYNPTPRPKKDDD